MSYRSTMTTYGAGSQATMWAALCAFVAAVGWVLEDTVSASHKVYSSVGEDGAHLKEYISISYSGNNVSVKPYLFWDAAAHTGYGGAFQDSSVNNINLSTAGTLYIYGSKDLVLLRFGTLLKMFGQIPVRSVEYPYAVLANAEAAGASVVIEVSDTKGFQINNYYQIASAATGCRERIQITAIVDGVSVTATLANNYPAGSVIAYAPSLMFISPSGSINTYLMPTCPFGMSGTGTATGTDYWIAGRGFTPPAGADPRNNRYTVQDMLFQGSVGSDVNSLIGKSIAHLGFASSASVVDDIFMCNDDDVRYDSGSASAGGATVLDDASKTWTDDAKIGDIVVLTLNTGAGQTRYITDNTATRLIVGQAWATNPVGGGTPTGYTICKRAYRNVDSASDIVCEERIGEP